MKKIISLALILTCSLCLVSCKKSAKSYNEEGLEALSSKNTEEAKKAFSHAYTQEKDNSAYAYNYAKSLYEDKEYADCVKVLENAVKSEKDKKRMQEEYYMLATSCFELKEADKGINAVENYVNIDYKTLSTYLKAYDLLKMYSYDKTAVSLLSQYDIKNQKSASQTELGLYEYYLGESDKAIDHFKQAVKKKDMSAYLNLAILYNARGDYKHGLDYVELFEKNASANELSAYQRGLSCMGTGDYEKAIESLNTYLSSSDKKYVKECMYNMIICYEKTLDYKSAYDMACTYLNSYDNEEVAREKVFLESRK